MAGEAFINGRIIKIQMPLAGEPNVLVYDESREWMYFGPLTDEIITLMRGSIKRFFMGYLINNEINIDFTSEVEDPGW